MILALQRLRAAVDCLRAALALQVLPQRWRRLVGPTLLAEANRLADQFDVGPREPA